MPLPGPGRIAYDAGGSGPTPPATPALWLRGDGFNVSTGAITDRSGNGRNATSPGAKPAVGSFPQGSVLYTKAQSQYSIVTAFNLPQPYIFGIVWSAPSWTNTARMLDSNGGDLILNQFQGTSQIGLFARGSFSGFNGSAEIGAKNYAVVYVSGNSSYVRIDGGPAVPATPGASGLTAGLTIASHAGIDFFVDMDLADLVFYPVSGSPAALDAQISNYFSSRYGISHVWTNSLSGGGDSLMASNSVSDPTTRWMYLLANGVGGTGLLGDAWGKSKNEGVASTTFVSGDTEWSAGSTGNSYMGDLSIDASWTRQLILDLYGHNDIKTDGVDLATLVARSQAWAAHRRAKFSGSGVNQLYGITIPDSTAFDDTMRAVKNAYNLLLLTNPGSLGRDKGLDLGSQFTADGAASNTTLFIDGTHFTVQGNATVAQVIAPQI